LAGKWTIDREKTGALETAVQYQGSTELDISVDLKTIVIVGTGGRAGMVKAVYNLDGSESAKGASVAHPGSMAATPSKATAKWDAGALVITTPIYKASLTSKYSIDGASLKFEFLNPQTDLKPRIAFYKRVS
jgi:NAD(P)H-dependent FMN reductase